MQIAFHIGANCTDEDQLIKTVLKNRATLQAQGIAVPPTSRYRTLLRETMTNLNGATPSAQAGEILLDSILDDDYADRAVLSNGNFICIPNRVFDHGLFYPQAEPKVKMLHQLFSEAEISLFLGIRNPATFLQEAFQRSNAATISEYLGLMQPLEIRWSDVVHRIKQAAPRSELTVWCNEDTPLLWEQLVRRLSGANTETQIVGTLDMLAKIVTREGIIQFKQRLQSSPPRSEAERYDMIADIWERYAKDDEVEDEIDIPDLDPALVHAMSHQYDADIAKIASMPGVKLLMPIS